MRARSFLLSAALLACSTAPEQGGESEQSELRAAICREPGRMLQPGSQTISSREARRERAPIPDCAGGRSADTAVYKLRVPERGSVKLASLTRVGERARLQPFRGKQCQEGSAGQWIGCRERSYEGYTTPYSNYGNEQYVKPGDDLVLAVAGIGGAELIDHQLRLTFEPSCGNGRAEDNLGAGEFSITNPTGPIEECEDGGRVPGDGCSASCEIESACVLTIPRIAGEAPAVLDVPANCRTARLVGNLPIEKTVVARINATSDDSVIATVLNVGGNTRYRKPRPTHSGEPWITVAVGPKLPDQTTWECGLAREERCAEQACTSENFLCRVRYQNAGGKTYVRVANWSARPSVSVDVRIDRNLADIYAYP